MTLVKDAARRGLWRNADGAVERGVHALVIGISEYPFLSGGSHAVPKPMGMGQLAVSAATGAQVFGWLRDTGRLAGRPVVTCRLLLAAGPEAPAGLPTETEFVDQLTDGWYEVPDFEAIRAATKAWTDELFQTPEHLTGENAAFLFFSGHGLQVLAQPSLLAHDILDPGTAAGRKNAVAYRSLLEAIPTYGLGDGLFLLDCCRNGPEAAQTFNMVGQDVLDPVSRTVAAPRSMKYLAAAESDGRAYQDPENPRRATLFGQAVLEALEGVEPNFHPYDLDCTPWKLMFEALESYTRGRVTQLLIERQAYKTQKVAAGGEASEQAILVAEREPPHGFAAGAPPPSSNPDPDPDPDPDPEPASFDVACGVPIEPAPSDWSAGPASLEEVLQNAPDGVQVIESGGGHVEL